MTNIIRNHRIHRFLAAGVAALSLSAVIGASTASAEVATIGGNTYGTMTVSTIAPTLQNVLCNSSTDTVYVNVSPGNVASYWTNVWYYNTTTRRYAGGGWLSHTGAFNTSVGSLGYNAPRTLTGAVGTWIVHVQLGYYDAAGRFWTTYNGWVPNYSNLYPGQAYITQATPGTTCVVR